MSLPSKRNNPQEVRSFERLCVPQSKIQAEHEFLQYVRITETFEMFDTLTCCQKLVEDPDKFLSFAT